MIIYGMFHVEVLRVTVLQGVELPIFLLIFEWVFQQCSANALPVILYKCQKTFYFTLCSKKVTPKFKSI